MAVITLKVRIEMTPEQQRAYRDEYGLGSVKPLVLAIREDLCSMVQNALQTAPALNVEQGCSQSIQVT